MTIEEAKTIVLEKYPDAKSRHQRGYDARGMRKGEYVYAVFERGYKYLHEIISDWSKSNNGSWISAANKILNEQNKIRI